MTMNDAHRMLAEIVGQLSLAIVRKESLRELIPSWVATLRKIADQLEKAVR